MDPLKRRQRMGSFVRPSTAHVISREGGHRKRPPRMKLTRLPQDEFDPPLKCTHNNKTYYGELRQTGGFRYSTFQTHENPGEKQMQELRCAFCSAANMIWSLKCGFCGSARVSDVPRMKHVMTTILRLHPDLTAKKFASQIMRYAQFDKTALEYEAKFKQATVIRTKSGMTMLSRIIQRLHHQIRTQTFILWRNEVHSKHRLVRTLHHTSAMYRYRSMHENKVRMFRAWK